MFLFQSIYDHIYLFIQYTDFFKFQEVLLDFLK